MAALGLGVKAQLAAVLAGHPAQVDAEAHRRHLVRLSVHPHGPLGAGRRVVDAADEVPRDRATVRALPDAGRPPPLGAPRVVADGVVDHRARSHLLVLAAVDGERAARGDARLLTRPHVLAPVRATRTPARFFVEAHVERDAPVFDQQPPRLGIDAALAEGAFAQSQRSRARQHARALAQLVGVAPIQRPEGLARGAELHERRAGHQLLAEDAHVAPSLQRPPAANQGMCAGGESASALPRVRRRLCLEMLTDQSIYFLAVTPVRRASTLAGGDSLLRVAAVQLNSTADPAENLAVADRLTRAAAADGASVIVLPEKWTAMGSDEQLRAAAEPLDGPAVSGRARSRASCAST